MRPVAAGYDVTLGGADGDWLAAVRRDGQVVRSKAARIGPLGLTWSGATPGDPGPYRVSWTGGAPEQDHAAATGWLAIGAGGSATITVPPTSAPAELTLFVGSDGTRLVVTGPGRVAWSPPAGSTGAAVVTVPIPASAAATTVVVGPAAGGTGAVGLVAVVLA